MAKINQQELARLLKLSQTTVSRSLANHPAINGETKALVLQAAAQLGYTQRIKKKSVRSGRVKEAANTIGVLISLPERYSSNSPAETSQDMLRGIAEKSALNGGALDMVYFNPGRDDSSKLLRRIRDCQWKGIILIHPVGHRLAYRIAHQAACVSIMDNYNLNLIDSVDVDQGSGIISLLGKLHRAGHRRIAFMTWVYQVPAPWVLQRFGSYVQGIFAHNLHLDIAQVINVRPGQRLNPYQCAERIRDLVSKGTTAVMCPADHQAYQLIQDLNMLGIRVPEDVSITGFDGVGPPFQAPQLDTVKVPYEELGRTAVHLLTRRMEQPTAPRLHILVDGELIPGSTIRDLHM